MNHIKSWRFAFWQISSSFCDILIDLIQIKSLLKFRSLTTLLGDVSEMRNALTAEFIVKQILGSRTLTR